MPESSLACPSCSTILCENGRTLSDFEISREADYSYDFWGPDYMTRRHSHALPHFPERVVVECGRCGCETDIEFCMDTYRTIQKRQPKKPKETYDKRIAGIRSWRVNEEGDLLSLAVSDSVWKAGEEGIAHCPVHSADAPQSGCKCGFNAFHNLEAWKAQEDTSSHFYFHITNRMVSSGVFDPMSKVVGIVSASGRTILAEHGWKAEKAQVEAIIAHKAEMEALGTKIDLRPALKRIAKKYGVPLIEVEEIDTFCLLQNLEQIGSLEGQPSELAQNYDPYAGPHFVYQPSVYLPSGWSNTYPAHGSVAVTSGNIPGGSISANLQPAIKALKKFEKSVSALASSSPGLQKALEKKRNRKPFYSELNKKKGLDKKPKGV